MTLRFWFLAWAGWAASVLTIQPAEAGAFVTNSVMPAERRFSTATLLANGQVLVAGGTDPSQAVLPSALLFDPVKRRWIPAGTMTVARTEHLAVRLTSGEVLVVGGHNADYLPSAELYQPADGTWSVTGSMATAHHVGTVTLLADGKVLVTGGFADSNGVDQVSAELYDPAAGSWSFTGSMSRPRRSHTATLLPGGKVLVVGGNGGGLPDAEVYDPVTGAWTPTDPLPFTGPHFGHTATLLPDGDVLVVGSDTIGRVPAVERFHPATGAWTTNAVPWWEWFIGHTATLLSNGRVLVAGGDYYIASSHYLASAFVYDPASGTWAVTGSMNLPRTRHNALLLPDGSVMFLGGYQYEKDPFGFVLGTELYLDWGAGMWELTRELDPGRDSHTATLLTNGNVLVVGGQANNAAITSSALFDASAGVFGAWSPTGAMDVPRYSHTATLLADGQVLVVGGEDRTDRVATSIVFNPASKSWSLTPQSMTTARTRHTATLLPGGKVLVAGGHSGVSFLRTAELFDPATGSWSPTGDLGQAREEHAAVRLASGKVLVAGGGSPAPPYELASAELYDPASGTWTPVAPMNVARIAATATPLFDGRVLVVGGRSYSSAELYDPAKNTWTFTDPAATIRWRHAATLLSNGKVLVTGGLTGAVSTDHAEVFDPVTEMWTPADRLEYARFSHTATLLSDGRVLVVGGSDMWPADPSYRVEIFQPPTSTEPAVITQAGLLPDGAFQLSFTNIQGPSFSVLAATNPAAPFCQWTTVGGVTEVARGQYRFADPRAANNPQCFYRVRSP